MSLSKRPTNSKLIKLIQKHHGLISSIARALKCSRNTVYRWVQEDDELEQALTDARESIIDETESQLIKCINSGNFPAIKFLLSTVGRSRGYTEVFEKTPDNQNILISFESIEEKSDNDDE